jgi:hypothetical protein
MPPWRRRLYSERAAGDARVLVRTKSSADSISGRPGLSGRDGGDQVVGSPVLKKNGSAAGETARIASDAVNKRERNDIADLHGETSRTILRSSDWSRGPSSSRAMNTPRLRGS